MNAVCFQKKVCNWIATQNLNTQVNEQEGKKQKYLRLCAPANNIWRYQQINDRDKIKSCSKLYFIFISGNQNYVFK